MALGTNVKNQKTTSESTTKNGSNGNGSAKTTGKIDVEEMALKKVIDSSWAYIEFEPDGTIIGANDNFLNTMGYNEKEILGVHHKVFCDKEYIKTNEYNQFWNRLANGKEFSGEFQRFTKAGDPVWLNAAYTPVLNQSGEVFKVIKIATDITDMIEARIQSDAIKAAVDTGWASIEFYPDGTIIDANQNFVNTLGYSSNSEFIGQHHRIFCEAEYSNSMDYQQFWSNLAAGQIMSGEFKRIRKDKQAIWINASYTPIKNDKGQVIKVIKIATDISSIKIPILEVKEVLEAISKGDLTKSLHSDRAEGYVKEMADSVSIAVDNLNSLMSNIGELANLVAASSEEMTTKSEEMKGSTGEMSSAIQQMAEGAQDQAQQVDEISKLLNSVLKSANEVVGMADTINDAAQNGANGAKEGSTKIVEMVENMSAIQKSAEVTSEAINKLTDRSEEIARTLNVITDIASQTNLLALNAAIEAARAGDAGRGFAVVAEEIRKLAEDSRNSAQDIEKVIKEVQKDISLADQSIKGMESSVISGNKASKEVEEVFVTIDETTNQTLQKSEEISKGASSQEAFINDSVKAVEKIVVVSEETASGTEQIASSSKQLRQGMDEVTATSKDLADIANQLLMGVSKFTVKND